MKSSRQSPTRFRSCCSCRLLNVAVLLAAGFVLATALAEDKPSATGSWKVTVKIPDAEPMETTLKLKQEGERFTGAYTGRDGTERPIEEGRLKGNEISFQTTRERDGKKSVAKFNGTLSGDTIKGKAQANINGEDRTLEWEATRVIAATIATGTWKYGIQVNDDTRLEFTLRLKQDGEKLSGTRTLRDLESPVLDGQVKDGAVSFRTVSERDGTRITSKFSGKLSGDSIKGKIQSDFGGQERTFDWDAKREK